MDATTYPDIEVATPLTPPLPLYNCTQCSHYLPEGALVCPECGTLAYGPHLNALAAAAASAERADTLPEARALWSEALLWLPADARQAEQIREHLATLGSREQVAADKKARWTKRLGPFAPVLLAATKLKTAFFLLFKLKFLLGFLSFFGLYWVVFGWRFAAGFMLSILVHEMGHYIAVRRRGLKADLPAFAFGRAYVRWYNEGLSLPSIAQIALAGPLFGLGVALVCAGLFLRTHNPLFAALSYATSWLNLFNLIPVLSFDGAQAALALSRLQRGLMLAACVILFALMHEVVFLLIGAGMTWRLFTNDAPEEESTSTLVNYLLLLFALGLMIYLVPNPGAIAR